MSKRESVVSRVIGRFQAPSPATVIGYETTNTESNDFVQTKSDAQVEIAGNFVQTKSSTQGAITGRPPVAKTAAGVGERMRELDPNECRLWEFADRPEHEAEHAEQLAKEFQSGVGQIHPAVVREVPPSDPQYPQIKYEIISGSVRWRASKIAGKTLKAVVRKLSDKDAITIMLSENNDRKDISEFARALQIGKVWNRGIFDSKSEMADSHRIEKAKLSQYLKVFDNRDTLIEKFGIDVYSMGLRTLYEASLSINESSNNQDSALQHSSHSLDTLSNITVESIRSLKKPKKIILQPFLSKKITNRSSSFFVQTKLDDDQAEAIQKAIEDKLIEMGII